MKDDNILNQAQQCVNVQAMKTALAQFKDFIPMITDLNKSLYDNMIEKGFSNEQAFDFACNYTLKIMFPGK